MGIRRLFFLLRLMVTRTRTRRAMRVGEERTGMVELKLGMELGLELELDWEPLVRAYRPCPHPHHHRLHRETHPILLLPDSRPTDSSNWIPKPTPSVKLVIDIRSPSPLDLSHHLHPHHRDKSLVKPQMGEKMRMKGISLRPIQTDLDRELVVVVYSPRMKRRKIRQRVGYVHLKEQESQPLLGWGPNRGPLEDLYLEGPPPPLCP